MTRAFDFLASVDVEVYEHHNINPPILDPLSCFPPLPLPPPKDMYSLWALEFCFLGKKNLPLRKCYSLWASEFCFLGKKKASIMKD